MKIGLVYFIIKEEDLSSIGKWRGNGFEEKIDGEIRG